MADIVSPDIRSRMMAGIKGKNTKPELLIRRFLHKQGFRYRLHVQGLPGKPDMVFPIKRAVILIHGCFWHWHNCHLFRWPSSRREFWRDKITRNRQNDCKCHKALSQEGWRILTIWECALKGKTRLPVEQITNMTAEWLRKGTGDMELRGE